MSWRPGFRNAKRRLHRGRILSVENGDALGDDVGELLGASTCGACPTPGSICTAPRHRVGIVSVAIRFAVERSAGESILVAATEKGVCGLLVGVDQQALRRELRDRFPRARLVADDTEFTAHVGQAVGATTPSGDLPADLRRSAPHHGVWQALRDEAA